MRWCAFVRMMFADRIPNPQSVLFPLLKRHRNAHKRSVLERTRRKGKMWEEMLKKKRWKYMPFQSLLFDNSISRPLLVQFELFCSFFFGITSFEKIHIRIDDLRCYLRSNIFSPFRWTFPVRKINITAALYCTFERYKHMHCVIPSCNSISNELR